MSKIEEVMRSEIMRLARKELRGTVGPLSKEFRELKRAVARLEKMVVGLEKAVTQKTQRHLAEREYLKASEDEVKTARVSARAIKNLRKKLGISQEKLAVLVGVSPATVAFWEQRRAKPRGRNKTALVALRKLGRRDVKRILANKGISKSERKGKKTKKQRDKK